MNDKLLKELVKKLNDRLKNNKFLLIYIEKMLWHFGNKELFTKENTRNYVIANKVKPKPLFCKKRGFVLLKK